MPFQRPGRGVLNMSAKARSRVAVQWLPVVLFLGCVAVSVLDTNATAASKVPVVANVAAGEPMAFAPQLTTRVEPAKSAQAEPPPKAFLHRLARRTAGIGHSRGARHSVFPT